MHFQRQMKRLLLIGFGLVLVLLGIVSCTTLITTMTLRDSNATVYQQLTLAENVRSLQYEIVAADHARDEYLHASDEQSLATYHLHIQNVAHIEIAIKSSLITTTGTISLAIFENKWADYLQGNDLMFVLLHNGNSILANSDKPSPDDSLTTLDSYVTQTTNAGDHARANTIRISASSTIVTMCITLIALSIGICSAWFLVRGINRIGNRLTLNLEELRLSHAALGEANARLEALATTDPLTELPNHRALVAILNDELERSDRYQHESSLLFIDLDHFKTINDNYGHPAGDIMLCELAHIVSMTLRSCDTVGRWGGEEFVTILPETTREQAQIAAERIRQAVAVHPFPVGGGLHMTCSIGVANYRQDAATKDELIAAADQAMYAAKHLGRNQVRVANDPSVQAFQMEQMGSREDIALLGTVEALITLVEARDHYTGVHTESVGQLVLNVALELALDVGEARMLQFAGKLHDIGKVGIPDGILCKAGPLTPEEWVVMRTHPVIGERVISQVPALCGIMAIVRAHHERWDGSGYPDGLAALAIPLGARIITVVDAYEAITTDRPYRQAQNAMQALAELYDSAGSQFDADVVQALERVLLKNHIITAMTLEEAA